MYLAQGAYELEKLHKIDGRSSNTNIMSTICQLSAAPQITISTLKSRISIISWASRFNSPAEEPLIGHAYNS